MATSTDTVVSAPDAPDSPDGSAAERALKHSLLILFAVGMLYPLAWMVAGSFKPAGELVASAGLWSNNWTLENYREGWFAVRGTFGLLFWNSAVISLLAIVGNLLTCSMAAYAFARLEFPGKRFLFALMLSTVLLPHHVVLIPQYILFNWFGWINTILPLVVPKFLATDAFFIFLMVQFIRALPRELDEAARIDGCGWFGIYWRIILPLTTPALATTAAFTFIWTWNDFFTPLVYLTDPERYTVPLGLNAFQDSTGQSSLGGLFAMGTLSLGPVLGFFILTNATWYAASPRPG